MNKEKLKKYAFILTEKQLDHVRIALFEWSEIEYATTSGKSIARAMREVLHSLNSQLRRAKEKENEAP